MSKIAFRTFGLSASALLTASAFGQEPTVPVINATDSVWMMVATALVLLMTPALALFYGGMVQKKNVLNTMLLSFMMMGVVSIIWVLVGYSLAFGKSSNGLIGGLEYLWGKNISLKTAYGTQTIPAALFMLFQMKFAIITPALISGAIAERVRFKAYTLFMIVWSIVIYMPIACWVWNADGWLFKAGALDFAGGTVVHLASGVSALALTLFLGKRKSVVAKANNIPFVLLGAGMLWFGWFGFNAGSALAMNDIAINAFLTTHIAAAAGMVTWMGIEMVRSPKGKVTAIGAASGMVAGLVAITPAAGYVSIPSAILIGGAVSLICAFAIELKHKLGYDDALDVVGVHGVGGLLGALFTGILADSAINPAVEASLTQGRGHLMFVQLQAVGATVLYAGVGTFVLAMAINKVSRLRSSESSEVKGLDLAYHGERGYVIPAPVTPASAEAMIEAAAIEPLLK